jgi:hypothetical protein
VTPQFGVLNVAMLNVIMLNVVILEVMAPKQVLFPWFQVTVAASDGDRTWDLVSIL